jgi:hypothetical protein
VRKSTHRKEARIKEVLAKRGAQPGIVHVLSAMEACPSYRPWYEGAHENLRAKTRAWPQLQGLQLLLHPRPASSRGPSPWGAHHPRPSQQGPSPPPSLRCKQGLQGGLSAICHQLSASCPDLIADA